MTNTRFHPVRAALAATATAALCAGALAATSTPAAATGDHDGDHSGGYDVVIPLSERASNQLRDGHNGVAATGKADSWIDRGRVVLSFPVAGDGHRARHGSDSTALKGGIVYAGAGPNISWTGLRVTDRGVITAVLGGGDRAPVLRVAGDKRHHDRSGDHGSARLVLTPSGAASLNNAAQGAPFDAGDVFAGGDDCR